MLDAPEAVPLACRFRTNLLTEITHALPDFEGRFDPMVCWPEQHADGRPMDVPFGIATFARRGLPIEQRCAATIIKHQDHLDAVPGLHTIVRPVQLTRLRTTHGPLVVANYHGLAQPGSKLDSDERLAQSAALRRVLADQHAPCVLIGDFNLLPDTESIRLLERDFRNLVTERGIRTTRSRLNPHHGKPTEQPHADYAFVSPALTVLDVQVPNVAISDHLPLILDLASWPP
jgi:endonuclease/exonuclease/phosphatase family metal-dependent hydrolase